MTWFADRQLESHIQAAEPGWLESMYQQYLLDESKVSSEWRAYFSGLPAFNEQSRHDELRHLHQVGRLVRGTGAKAPVDARMHSGASGAGAFIDDQHARVMQIVQAHRERGHLQADIDPLELHPKVQVPDLHPAWHGLDQGDMERLCYTGSLNIGVSRVPLRELLQSLNSIYKGSIGWEYMHLPDSSERDWFQQRIEPCRGIPETPVEQRIWLLRQLTAAEGLESYLASRFAGAKRFGLEGGDSLIPLVSGITRHSTNLGTREIVIAMAHRGRLNMLVNVLGKSPEELFAEFENRHQISSETGDVKYHQGFSSNIQGPGGVVHLALMFNPSHLEIASPVALGSVRARQDHRGYQSRETAVLPLLIHGDASFAGQGVIMETLQMSQTRGFCTGGTLHIVINNQIGFTTSNPSDARSTHYCTDVAKMIDAPIIHVNGDNPEAVLFAGSVALDFRDRFHRDIVIDLVCYRRRGHNEADDPYITQPMMYSKIGEHETARARYAKCLQDESVISPKAVEALMNSYRDRLERGEQVAEGITHINEMANQFNWKPHLDKHSISDDIPERVDTGFERTRLQELGQIISADPDGVQLHPQVAKLLEDRRKMSVGSLGVNWGFAENLAYATLLDEDYSIRITGEDVRRGTFSHRHVILHNQAGNDGHIPLTRLARKNNQFEIYDSLLSEEGVLGFEFGYSATVPQTLVIWEAQFGDFANGAQIIIDQFIASGYVKWGRLSGLTVLLPHGYEGQGPEHSSARLERYLQLCAEHNIDVCVPSNAAQIFHLLRHQIKRLTRRPLIVMSPKSLLRLSEAASPLEDLFNGTFRQVIGERELTDVEVVKTAVLCSGKVYYDLRKQRAAEGIVDRALVRIEQLYPFPYESMLEELRRYSGLGHLIWCQEEPMNQGAWLHIQHKLQVLCDRLGLSAPPQYHGRAASSSPSTGYMSLHLQQQHRLCAQALGLED